MSVKPVSFPLDETSMLKRWDFAVTIEGQRYPMRPMRMIDCERLQAVMGRNDYAAIRKWVAGMFDGAAPDLRPCRPERVMVMLAELLSYWKQSCAEALEKCPKSEGIL